MVGPQDTYEAGPCGNGVEWLHSRTNILTTSEFTCNSATCMSLTEYYNLLTCLPNLLSVQTMQ